MSSSDNNNNIQNNSNNNPNETSAGGVKLDVLSILVPSPNSIFPTSPDAGYLGAMPPSLTTSAINTSTPKTAHDSPLLARQLDYLAAGQRLMLPADINLPDFQVKDKSSIRFDIEEKNVLSAYVIKGSISSGPCGKIFKAVHVQTKELVAIKRLEKTADRLDLVKREVSTIRKLHKHSNICSFLDILEDSIFVYLILPCYPGGDLFELVSKKGFLPEDEVRIYFAQIVFAVKYCHENGVVHRDLKLENFMLDGEGRLKLIDFGLSNFYTPDALMQTNCGSPNYAAPEMVANKKYDGRMVDVWSMGVILYAMLVGKLPFDDIKTTKMYSNITTGKYKWPFPVNHDLEDLVAQMLQVDAERRIKLKDIIDHPWMKKIQIDNAIVHQKIDLNEKAYRRTLAAMKCQHADLDAALAKEEPSALFATYDLFLEKLYRDTPTAPDASLLQPRLVQPESGFFGSELAFKPVNIDTESAEMDLIRKALAKPSAPALAVNAQIEETMEKIRSKQILQRFNRM